MTIVVDINPIAKGRPRFFRRGKHVGVITPGKTRAYENTLIDALKRANVKRPLSGPVSLNLTFYMPIPASRKRIKGIGSGAVPHSIKPDLDNLIKAATDAANGILWEDDSQIACVLAAKYYSDKPRIVYYIPEMAYEKEVK